MEGESNSSLFANDGSFLERFKQLQQQQQQQEKEQTSSQSTKTGVSSESADSPKTSMVIKKASSFKPVVLSKTGPTPANGKLAFSLKQKSKLAAAPVKLGGDEEDEDYSEDGKGQSGRSEKRQKLDRSDNSENSQDAQQHGFIGLSWPLCALVFALTLHLSRCLPASLGSFYVSCWHYGYPVKKKERASLGFFYFSCWRYGYPLKKQERIGSHINE